MKIHISIFLTHLYAQSPRNLAVEKGGKNSKSRGILMDWHLQREFRVVGTCDMMEGIQYHNYTNGEGFKTALHAEQFGCHN
jgi:hypothetical protein